MKIPIRTKSKILLWALKLAYSLQTMQILVLWKYFLSFYEEELLFLCVPLVILIKIYEKYFKIIPSRNIFSLKLIYFKKAKYFCE